MSLELMKTRNMWILLAVTVFVAGNVAACSENDDSTPAQDLAAQDDTPQDSSSQDVAQEDMSPADQMQLDQQGEDVAQQDLEPDTTGPVESALAAPEGVVVVDGKVFVTNVNGAWNDELSTMEYGPGYLTVLDAETLERVGHVELGCTNPQYAIEAGGSVLVACSGKVAMDENWVMTPVEAGKLVKVSAATMKVEAEVELPMGQPDAMVGFPGSLCRHEGTGRIFIGAATGPFVFVVEGDLAGAPQVVSLYDMAGGNDSITVECGEETVWAASFNTGDMYEMNAETLTLEGNIKVTETNQLEGPTDILALGGKLYVLNTISSKVAVVDLSDDSVTFPVVTGATPNRLALMGTTVFVVNSTDNNLTKYDTVSGKATTPFGAMDPGTNPWEMAVSGTFGYVTGYVANTVVKLDLDSGDVVLTVGNN